MLSVEKKDIINVFIVYRLKSYFASNLWRRNGELITSGDTNGFNVIGTNQILGKYPIGVYKTKANAGELNGCAYQYIGITTQHQLVITAQYIVMVKKLLIFRVKSQLDQQK